MEQNTTTKKPQQLKAVSVQNGYDTYKAGSLLLRALYSDRHHLDRLSHTQAQSLHPHKRGALVFIKAQPHTRTQTHSHTHAHTHVYILSPSLRVCLTLSYTAHTRAHRHAQVIALHGASEQLIITIPVKLTLSRHPSLV